MIKLAQKISGCVGGEVVGCRAAEHRDKENGIDKARGEDRPVANTCGDAHQDSRADYAREAPVACVKRSAASSPARYWMNPVAALIASQPIRSFRCPPGVYRQHH